LQRIETSAAGGRFDAEAIFFSDDLPSLEGDLNLETCKWAYARVSTARPDVPECQP
jgi:hypothetical protein